MAAAATATRVPTPLLAARGEHVALPGRSRGEGWGGGWIKREKGGGKGDSAVEAPERVLEVGGCEEADKGGLVRGL